MVERILAHVRGNAVGYLALFVALSGTAYAAATINSGDVIDNSLKSIDLRDNRAVKGVDVRSNTLTGDDIDEASLEGLDAATFDGRTRLDFLGRSFISGPAAQERNATFYSYLMVTGTAGTDYVLGQIKLRTTANPGEFQVCGATGLSFQLPYILYLNGTRTAATVAGDACASAVDVGAGGDFEVAANGMKAFGTPTLDPTSEHYYVFGVQSS
jgi:hypothetical protein